MFLLPLSLILLLLILWRLVLPLKAPLWVKFAVGLLVAFTSCKYIIYRYIGGSIAGPDLPPAFLVTMEVLFMTLLFTGFFLAVRECVRVVLWILRRVGILAQRTCESSCSHNKQVVGIALLSLVLASYGVWNATKVPDVRTIEITIPNLPKAFDGFVIVQLTDTHVGPILQKAWLEEVVAKTMALDADMIVFTGDFIDGSVEKVGPMIAPLADLQAPYGVYGVMGNHEYISEMPYWNKVFKKLGFDMLHNEHRTIERDGATLILAGVTDPASMRYGLEGPDRAKALAKKKGQAEEKESFVILLDHQAKHGFQNPHADLQLSGHTHGGQMYLFEYIVAAANGGYVRGLYEQDGQQLYVSNGAALWHGFSCRIGIDSEITKIVLR